jgi:hypothetical protein
MTIETVIRKHRTLGLVGIFAGFLALAVAFLSPWIQDAIDPPAKPSEEKVVEFAGRIAAAAKAKIKGEEYTPTTVFEPLPSRFLAPGIIGLGMLAAGFGILSLINAEPRMIGSGAIALGVSASVVQWSIVIAGAILFFLLVFAVISLLGG